jgi:hypothetical protein
MCSRILGPFSTQLWAHHAANTYTGVAGLSVFAGYLELHSSAQRRVYRNLIAWFSL